jgi:hypothetical protein
MSEYLDEWERRERSLLAEIAALKAENERLKWDLAHYRDVLMLRCGVTSNELAGISYVLKLERERKPKASPAAAQGSGREEGK